MPQIATDTELSAVNSILGSIGQSPVTATTGTALNNPEISFIVNLLGEVNKDVQNEGWHFNTEYHESSATLVDSNGHITIGNDILRYDISDGQSVRSKDVVRRNGKLYDLVNHTYVLGGEVSLDVTRLVQFVDLPPVFQRYVISRAASRAAVQLVSNAELVKLLQTQEAYARASVMEYETQQGDHSYMGWDHNSSYRSYQPYKALRR